MSIETRAPDVTGNPVQRELLLRSLRSNTNVVIVAVWSVLIATIGAAVLMNRVGLNRPFHTGSGAADELGATLAQWWIVSVTVGAIILAVVLAAVGCAANDERHRLQSWTTTLVGPRRMVMGIWRAQLALVILALALALPVAAIALSLGGTSVAQLGVGLAAAFIGGATASALTIALACRSRRVLAPLTLGLAIVIAVFAGPVLAHLVRAPASTDPVMVVVPVVGVADAATPLAPHARVTKADGQDAAAAPLAHLRANVEPWSGRVPPWGFTTAGALVVLVVSLFIARLRIARPSRASAS